MTDSTPQTQQPIPPEDCLECHQRGHAGPCSLLVRLSAADRQLVADALARPDWVSIKALVAVRAAVERAEGGEDKWLQAYGPVTIYDLHDGPVVDMPKHPRVSSSSTPSSAASPPRYFRTTNNGLPGVTEFQ